MSSRRARSAPPRDALDQQLSAGVATPGSGSCAGALGGDLPNAPGHKPLRAAQPWSVDTAVPPLQASPCHTGRRTQVGDVEAPRMEPLARDLCRALRSPYSLMLQRRPRWVPCAGVCAAPSGTPRRSSAARRMETNIVVVTPIVTTTPRNRGPLNGLFGPWGSDRSASRDPAGRRCGDPM